MSEEEAPAPENGDGGGDAPVEEPTEPAEDAPPEPEDAPPENPEPPEEEEAPQPPSAENGDAVDEPPPAEDDAPPPAEEPPPPEDEEPPPAEDYDPPDVANSEEERDFEEGVRQDAMDFDANDADQDHRLDFDEFCELVREREEGHHPQDELRSRFEQLDADGSGKVELNEYIRFSLRDALSRSASRVIDIFKQWDDDGSGEIDKREFRRAIQALGFNFFANDAEIDMVFEDFDVDKNGTIEYKELNKMIRQGAGAKIDPKLLPGAAGEIQMTRHNKHKLRTAADKKKGTKFVFGAKIELESDLTIQQQLVEVQSRPTLRPHRRPHPHPNPNPNPKP